jgi:hypothetical protein
MAFLDDVKEKTMAASAQAVRKAPPPDLEEANLFELRYNHSRITYTASDIAGEPQVSVGSQSFRGDEIRREKSELGTLVTVTLSEIPDLERRLLTLVLPEVLLDDAPEKVSVPVVFTRVELSIAGRPLKPGPVQTYDVKIYKGKASFIVTAKGVSFNHNQTLVQPIPGQKINHNQTLVRKAS